MSRRKPAPVLTLITATDDARSPLDPPLANRPEIGHALLDLVTRMSTFDGWLEALGLEARARRVAELHQADQAPALDSQAWYAQEILGTIPLVHAAVDRGDADGAARAALDLGWLLARAAIMAEHDRRRHGGRLRGGAVTEKAAEHDQEIRRLLGRWRLSDELQDRYRSPAAYIAGQIKLSIRKVERRIKVLAQTRPA